jgi:two-component system response regulator NreC
MPIRILIADDHGVLRAGLLALLNAEEDMIVVGDAADGAETLELAQRLQPDVLLLDLSLPDINGIDVTRQLKEQTPAVRVLVLTVHEDKSLLQAAIRAGAAGYILKKAVASDLVNAIQSVARGDMYVYPPLTRSLIGDFIPVVKPEEPMSEVLTPRELEVLKLVAKGYTSGQIADQLVISARTVESHRANLMDKLDLHNRAELVRYAMNHGFLEVS